MCPNHTTKTLRICQQCKKEYMERTVVLKTGRGKFCSRDCFNASQRVPIARNCQRCGKSFTASRSEIASGRGKYCSKPCSYAARKRPVECTCLTCNKTFTTKESRVADGGGKYCCLECSYGNRPFRSNGTYISDGYRMIYCPDHPRAQTNGYVREHIVIAEEMIGRPLKPGEICHHKDSNRLNNDPSNIEVLPSQSEHAKLHARERRLQKQWAKAEQLTLL